MLELVAIAVALIGTAKAAWQDFKTSFIDEKITYSMIGAGFSLTLMNTLNAPIELALAFTAIILAAGYFFLKQYPNITPQSKHGGFFVIFLLIVPHLLKQTQAFGPNVDYGLLILSFNGAAVIFGLGWLLYKTGKLGGGDVLLYTGLQLLLPVKPHALDGIILPYVLTPDKLFQWQLLSDIGLPFFLSIFLLSTMLALLGSSIVYAWRLRKLKLKPELLSAGLGLVAVIGFAYVMNVMGASLKATAFYAIFLLPSALLLAFRKQLMDEVIVQKVTIAQVEDEDILVLDKMPQAIVKKYSLGPVLTKSEVEKLKLIVKKEKITKFPVAKVLPRLGPYVFLAVLLGVLGLDLFTIILAIA
jgi:Flp pilus assembly protein protease CpaA